jgi:putative thioredoxin
VAESAAGVIDVDDAGFEREVVERSREIPVVVDFWAEWCAPCRQLTPALERAAAERAGKVVLAKVDVDANPVVARGFGIRGIPAVKAFRDGRIASEFTGALPPAEVERFFDALVPSEADELAARADEERDEQALRRVLEVEPGHAEASRELARLLIARGERDEALERLDAQPGDFAAQGLAARARLDGLDGAFEAWDRGDAAAALEQLQEALAAEADARRRDLIRQAMVGLFTELGPDDPLAREHRRRLSAALN